METERLLICYCAPTLAGLKTAGLFNAAFPSPYVLARYLREWNHRLNGKGISLCALRFRKGKALIYVYRTVLLEADLRRKAVSQFLEGLGYGNTLDLRTTLGRLRYRVTQDEGFPHEIGLFLGYPLEDVWGFIQHGGRNCRYTGCWKVYGDVACAQRLFEKYHKCKKVYLQQLLSGRTVEQLTVALPRIPALA